MPIVDGLEASGTARYADLPVVHSERKFQSHPAVPPARLIEATSLEEAQKLFYDILKVEQEYEEYSASAWVSLDNVQFINDPVVGSQITSSDPYTMPLRQAGCIEYSFTEQETKYLTTDNTFQGRTARAQGSG